jgi:hypothetical protein
MSSHAPAGLARTARPAATLSRGGRIFMAVFLIVVFEGAIRKWVASSTSLPLIALRDLLAVYLVFYAWRGGYFRRYQKVFTALFAWTLLVVGWGLMQLVGGESSPTVFVIGLRFWLLYSWFAVAAAATMTEADFAAAVRLAVLAMIVLAPLAVLQHYSPPGAAINRQLEGDEDDVFVVISGVVRTTGTFTFTSGYSTYLIMVAPLVFGLWAARKRTQTQRLFALAGFGAFIIGSVVSGSRAGVISAGSMLGAYLIARLVFAKARDKPAALGAAVLASMLTAGFLFFFSDAIQVTQQRFEQASTGEDFGERLLATFIGEPQVLDQSSWLGKGIGAGSNLATSLYEGTANFALAESETGRIVLEGGLLGFAYIALKLGLLVGGLGYCLRLSVVRHAAFPMILWISVVIGVLTWPAIGQLTANGLFGVLLGFFLLLFRYPSGDFFPARSSPS